jgi:hypothetical protein
LPPWEHLHAKFDIDLNEEKKDQTINILVSDGKQHLVEKFSTLRLKETRL